MKIQYKFVEYIPELLEEGILYISPTYCTAIHKCVCGCNNEVVTPISSKDWQLVFDGTISLYPSIGNWSFACQSHYWIRKDQIVFARKWTEEEIEEGREKERKKNKKYFFKRRKKRKK